MASSSKPRTAVWVSVFLVGLLALGGGGYYFADVFFGARDSLDEAEILTEVFPDEEGRPAPSETGSTTILLLGSDTRGGIGETLASAEGDRSDVMVVIRISGDREHVTAMSIMRDMWVEIPGRGENKVNAALALGGVPLTVQTVENLLDTRIDHVAVLDFEGFAAITDVLGGVTVTNERAFTPVTLPEVTFPQGEVTLNGTEALAFVRERMAFASGDFQRVRNQQAYVKGLASKILDTNVIADSGRIRALFEAVSPYFARDEALTADLIIRIGGSLRNVTSEDIMFFTMPNLGTGTRGGQSVVVVDFDEVEIIKGLLQDDLLHTYQPAQ
jgi:polyisoprenyl-teichoic acid--peptidoglycan teichoic acid transferase